MSRLRLYRAQALSTARRSKISMIKKLVPILCLLGCESPRQVHCLDLPDYEKFFDTHIAARDLPTPTESTQRCWNFLYNVRMKAVEFNDARVTELREHYQHVITEQNKQFSLRSIEYENTVEALSKEVTEKDILRNQKCSDDERVSAISKAVVQRIRKGDK